MRHISWSPTWARMHPNLNIDGAPHGLGLKAVLNKVSWYKYYFSHWNGNQWNPQISPKNKNPNFNSERIGRNCCIQKLPGLRRDLRPIAKWFLTHLSTNFVKCSEIGPKESFVKHFLNFSPQNVLYFTCVFSFTKWVYIARKNKNFSFLRFCPLFPSFIAQKLASVAPSKVRVSRVHFLKKCLTKIRKSPRAPFFGENRKMTRIQIALESRLFE